MGARAGRRAKGDASPNSFCSSARFLARSRSRSISLPISAEVSLICSAISIRCSRMLRSCSSLARRLSSFIASICSRCCAISSWSCRRRISLSRALSSFRWRSLARDRGGGKQQRVWVKNMPVEARGAPKQSAFAPASPESGDPGIRPAGNNARKGTDTDESDPPKDLLGPLLGLLDPLLCPLLLLLQLPHTVVQADGILLSSLCVAERAPSEGRQIAVRRGQVYSPSSRASHTGRCSGPRSPRRPERSSDQSQSRRACLCTAATLQRSAPWPVLMGPALSAGFVAGPASVA